MSHGRNGTLLTPVVLAAAILTTAPVRVFAQAITFAICVLRAAATFAQAGDAPQIRAGALTGPLTIDGVLDEPVWSTAEPVDRFTQADPDEGAPATARTIVRVLARKDVVVVGIVCDDPEPARIVSFSVRRDAPLTSEDHVRLVFGPFLDGRSGYVFAVNPSGARYDGLVNPGGESDNPDWDGIWQAATARTSSGWSVEVWIPVQSLSFPKAGHQWHFNVQRRIQRRLETDRWAFPARQYRITQTSRAGLITNLPDFDLGLGLTVRPAVTTGGGVPAPSASTSVSAWGRTCSRRALKFAIDAGGRDSAEATALLASHLVVRRLL